MITGYASAAATTDYMKNRGPIACNQIGTTGLTASQAGFGCYRVSAGVPHHEKALHTAICEGINLIDTSTNYADGGSETLAGMRRAEYVSDIMAELRRPVQQDTPIESWRKLTAELTKVW